ncbi:mechanosensitive ion channel family protein [Desulfolutivibrio sulfoxidireducens]|uniref:mechanosensitive ion channel family protein n=1 Tax=Desulfolutivibrio sulfoxidireducens TaxID=2773299 RepID=UPI00159D91E5|nr:mechanosensitive ion channel domain-containing protein [Desulfolutivibrio sulfoxidireducens]QLA15537.1 mechanosensitive ion channel [Desulfolutivibrio sulfoxidireducens]
MNIMRQRPSRFLVALTLALCVFAPRFLAAQTSEGEDWKLVMRKNQEALILQAVRFKSMDTVLPKLMRDFRRELGAIEAMRDQLTVITSLTSGNPWELRAVLHGVDRLRGRSDTLMEPFRGTVEELGRISERIETLEGEFSRQAADKPEDEVAQAIDYYQRYVAGVKKALDRVKGSLERELAPAARLQAGLLDMEKNVRERLPGAWKDFFLTPAPSVLTLSAWADPGLRLELWLSSLGVYQAFFSGEQGGSPLDGLAKPAALALGALLAASLLSTRIMRRFPGLQGALGLRGVLRYAGLGLAFAWAAAAAPFLLFEGMSVLAEIFFAATLLAFSRFVSVFLGDPEAQTARNPLRSLFLLFSCGLALRVAGLPSPFAELVWAGLLVFLALATPRRSGGGTAPDLITILSAAGRWFFPLLALAAIMGYANLSLIFVSAWFLALAFLQCGLRLQRLISGWLLRAQARGVSLLVRGVVRGLGLPLVHLGLFFLALYWFCAQLGGRSVFYDVLDFKIGYRDIGISVGRLAILMVEFHVARAAVAAFKAFVPEAARLRPEWDQGVQDVLSVSATYIVWGLYALSGLFLLGADFTSLAVVAGGLSVGIGFGLQNIVNNFVSGLILLFGRSIQAGDTIQIGETWCQVQKVNIRNTVVTTFENATIFVPNSDLITGKLVNWTHKDPRARRQVDVGVAYGSDTNLVRDLLVRAAAEHPRVLADPAPVVQFLNFGESSLDFRLMFWVDHVTAGLSVSSEIRFTIDRLFREAGLSIPFPQREVRVVSESAPCAGSVQPPLPGPSD